jgi:hypothetical protein
MLYTKLVLNFENFYDNVDKVYVNDAQFPIWLYSEHEGIVKIITEYKEEKKDEWHYPQAEIKLLFVMSCETYCEYSVKIILSDYRHKVEVDLEKGKHVYNIDWRYQL